MKFVSRIAKLNLARFYGVFTNLIMHLAHIQSEKLV